MSVFARHYEKLMLRLENLTPHQRVKLAEIEVGMADTRSVRVHAPAGAGKTFLALALMLRMLEPDGVGGKSGERVLFVVKNAALAQFVAVWVTHRLKDEWERDATISRLWVLTEPTADGDRELTHRLQEPRQAAIVDGRVEFKATPKHVGLTKFDMIVVDEAHHLYVVEKSRTTIESHCRDGTRRLLLCDISQSLGAAVPYPEGVEVVLEQVVRSSKRIFMGAMVRTPSQCHIRPRPRHLASMAQACWLPQTRPVPSQCYIETAGGSGTAL